MDQLTSNGIDCGVQCGTASFRILTGEELDAVSGGDLIKVAKRAVSRAKSVAMWEQACRDGSWFHCNILDEIRRDGSE